MISHLERGQGSHIGYVHHAPADGRPTLVFINAITGSWQQWEQAIAPGLRNAGFGTLAYDLRGQADSPLPGDTPITLDLIVEDLRALLDAVAPHRPILVGLSVGGLFAAHAIARGAAVSGLVLLNTLRAPSPTLAWTNEALYRAARLGGTRLLADLFFPMLVGRAHLTAIRENHLSEAAYEPWGEDEPVLRLLEAGRHIDWAFDWSQLTMPVLNITGAQDRVFLVREDVAALAAAMPQARAEELTDAGHLLPVEAPETLTLMLRDFANGFVDT